MAMNKTAVLSALKRGATVCWRTSRHHVGCCPKEGMYVFNVLTGESSRMSEVADFSECFIHVGGVGSDD